MLFGPFQTGTARTSKHMAAEQRLQIVIGNKRYSSWSLRGWLALRVAAGEAGFDEVYLPLAGAGAEPAKREEARQRLLEHSPTGLVPVRQQICQQGTRPRSRLFLRSGWSTWLVRLGAAAGLQDRWEHDGS